MSQAQVDIRPLPTADERRAIEQALAALGLLEPAVSGSPAAAPSRPPAGHP